MQKTIKTLAILIFLTGLVAVGYADTPEQAMATIAGYLEAGNVDAALGRYTLGEQEKSRQVLTSLDEAGRKRMATSLRNAKIKEMKAEYCTVNVPTQIPNGQTIDSEMMLVQDGKGSWMINSW